MEIQPAEYSSYETVTASFKEALRAYLVDKPSIPNFETGKIQSVAGCTKYIVKTNHTYGAVTTNDVGQDFHDDSFELCVIKADGRVIGRWSNIVPGGMGL